MQKEVMVALISLAGTIAGSFGGVLASSKLTTYRLRLLENKVDKHNRFAERLPVVEEKIKVLKMCIRDRRCPASLQIQFLSNRQCTAPPAPG